MPLALMKQDMSAGKIAGLLFLEAAVIFAGITSSFWIEEWRENREDLDTYQHLLEEIYYNTVLDEAGLPLAIATNNLALKYALELAVLDAPIPSDRELYEELSHVFGGVLTGINTAGYVRLSNTPLSLPFDETMVTLDGAYASLSGLQEGVSSVNAQLSELRAEHWNSAGMVSCTGRATNDGSVTLMEQPYMAEIRDLLYPDGICITQNENEERARELMARPEFRNALRQVIELRQGFAWMIGWQQGGIDLVKSAIESRFPGIGLPIVSVELVNWPGENTLEAVEERTSMDATGPDLWETTLDLPPGFIKFRANDDWSINWGAPFPNIIDEPGFLWSSDRVRVEDVFPSGVADFNGVNLPVRGGRYRVSFNSRSGEYSFEEVETGP